MGGHVGGRTRTQRNVASGGYSTGDGKERRGCASSRQSPKGAEAPQERSEFHLQSCRSPEPTLSTNKSNAATESVADATAPPNPQMWQLCRTTSTSKANNPSFVAYAWPRPHESRAGIPSTTSPELNTTVSNHAVRHLPHRQKPELFRKKLETGRELQNRVAVLNRRYHQVLYRPQFVGGGVGFVRALSGRWLSTYLATRTAKADQTANRKAAGIIDNNLRNNPNEALSTMCAAPHSPIILQVDRHVSEATSMLSWSISHAH